MKASGQELKEFQSDYFISLGLRLASSIAMIYPKKDNKGTLTFPYQSTGIGLIMVSGIMEIINIYNISRAGDSLIRAGKYLEDSK